MKRLPLQLLFLLSFSILLLSGCKKKSSFDSRDDFKKFYDQYHVDGSFVLYDLKKDHYLLYNPQQYHTQFTPASTFKICNTLIGLETGVIKNENYVLKWDSVERRIPSWNQDQDLSSAFKNSCVWYYQDVARKVGRFRMKHWLDVAHYGNTDTSGGIDQFWLSGALRISPEEQIDFLKKLHLGVLPFSKRSIDIVKKIMIAKDTNGCIIRAKSGWGNQDNMDIGWYLGYIETKNNTYFFSNCIQSANPDNPDFARARVEIFYKIVGEMGLLTGSI